MTIVGHVELERTTMHPYNIILIQELNKDDFDVRILFCEVVSKRAMGNPFFSYRF